MNRPPPPPWACRAIVAIVLPFSVVITYIAELVYEIRAAFRHAYLAARIDIEAGKKMWRTGKPND